MVFTAALTAIAVIAAMVTVPWAKAGAAEPTDFVPNTTLGAENAKIGGDHSWGQLVWAGVPPEGARNPHKNNDVGWGWCIDYTVADPMLKKGSYKKSTAGAIRFDDPKFQNAAIGIAMKLRDATAAGDKKLANRYSVYLAALVSDASGRAAAIKFIHANDGGNVSGLARPLHGFDGNSEDFTANTGLRILKDNAQTLDQQFEADPSVTIPEQPADAFITVVGPNGITTHNSGGGQRVVPIDQPGLPDDGGENPGKDEESNPNPKPTPSESTETEPSTTDEQTTEETTSEETTSESSEAETTSEEPTTEETTEPSEPSTTDEQTTEETTSEETPSESTDESTTEETEEPTPTPTTDVVPEPTPTTSQQEKPRKPEIKTQAKFDGDKQQVVAGATVIDTVHYEDLVPGKKYTLKAELRNKAADANGEHAVVGTGSQEFTAEAESGDVAVKINVDKQLESPIAAAVAFEKLFSSEVDKDGNDISGSHEEKEIATHEDINDEAQTVITVWNPEIGTTAKFKDGNRVVEGATVIDTVTYKDLVPGKNYTLKAKLISKEDGTTVLGEATHTFTAENSAGSEDVEIVVNDKAKDGVTAAVAFEKLFSSEVDEDGNDISGSTEEKEIAKHEDINDEAQTVTSELNPSIKTKAEFDNAKQVAAGVVVKDTVSYTDLVPGKEYTLKAELRNKALNENGEHAVIGRGDLTFTPKSSVGEVVVDIKVNEDLEGVVKTAVAFEKLYSKQVDETGKDAPKNEGDGNEITTHENINDEDQTVTSEEEPSESTTPENPGEETTPNQPGEETTPNQPGEETTPNEPGEETTPNEPGEETTPNEPGEETTPNEPGEETTPNEPGEETTPNQPGEETTPNEPGEETTPNEPGEETDKPKISTNADFANGATEVVAGAKVNDTVTYEGLVPGMEYTLKAELISKVDGKSVLGKGEKTFTPDAADGEVVVEIIVADSVKKPVEAAVAFEELTSVEVNDKGEETPGTDPEEPNHIAEHKDINDKNQTVPKPSEETTPNNPGEETTPNQPGEETTPNNPGEETTPNEPGEETTPNQPGEETTPNQPGEETTPNKPGEETTPNEPGEETTPNEPGEETTPNQPGEETTPNNPGEETTPNKPGDEPSESTTETPDDGDGKDKDDNDGSSKKSDLPWWLLLIPGLGLIKLIIDGGNSGDGGHDGGHDGDHNAEVIEDNGRGGDHGESTGDNAGEPSEQTGDNTGRDDREVTVLDATQPEDSGQPLPSNAERVEIKHVPSGATKLDPGMKDFIK